MRFTIPIRTVSELNQRGHWGKRDKRASDQRGLASILCRDARFVNAATITITRIAPRMLDDDNLTGAMKAIRDGIADALAGNGCIKRVKQGRYRMAGDDRDPRLAWRYEQRTGKEYGVEVEITERAPT